MLYEASTQTSFSSVNFRKNSVEEPPGKRDEKTSSVFDVAVDATPSILVTVSSCLRTQAEIEFDAK